MARFYGPQCIVVAAAVAVVKLGVAYCRGINAEGSQMTILICRQLALD